MALLLIAALLLLPLLAWGAWVGFVRDYVAKPWILEAKLRRQGIGGPPRSILRGNIREMMEMRAAAEERCMEGISHDIVGYAQPHSLHWEKIYGSPMMMWWGYEPRIVLTDLDMVKDVLYNKSGVFWRSSIQQKFLMQVIGRGLVVVNGDEWAFRRHIMSPAFYQEKIKGMVGTMVDCVSEMLDKWLALTRDSSGVEVEVSEPITELTADVISRTAFGSGHAQGRRVLELVQELTAIILQRFSKPWIESMNPFSELNRAIRNGQKKVNNLLLEIVHARQQLKDSGASSNYGSDLLGLMLDEVDSSRSFSGSGIKPALAFTSESLIEECKTFYVAGHETTAKLITWAMMLLATNPTWQERARAEVLEVCKSGVPDSEAASKLKIVGMVLNETLRLYPPAVFLVRTAMEDTKLGNLIVPEGTGVLVPILSILHDKEVWGEDANEFNPQRFADGVANASKHPFAFLPFSHRPRVCLGQGFALMEAKVALTMILHRFSLEISPSYQHSPVLRLTLTPKHGMPKRSVRKLTTQLVTLCLGLVKCWQPLCASGRIRGGIATPWARAQRACWRSGPPRPPSSHPSPEDRPCSSSAASGTASHSPLTWKRRKISRHVTSLRVSTL